MSDQNINTNVVDNNDLARLTAEEAVASEEANPFSQQSTAEAEQG